ncbi:type V CRISPR-associated protein Cas4 [Moraxella haemolytica]|uniref:type V CRISPR-associated protein Cas4 n=1 Tax=Moraxella TaxID=475 RepID=UPI0025432CE3|nr:type V CRISPR-associated protein Cas4 [Moraxella sp. ZY171148]WII95869.1 type V CRISPR-associated protein Cas4 [Moraxella sp. ZY171148]
MEHNVLNISQLNDFVFCPYSIYLHNVYQGLDEEQYHDTPQVAGKQAHETVDNGSYSTKKDILTGIFVYSEEYGLMGKIDQYFTQSKKLIERKKKIKTIYDGYKLQLYAQYFCLIEMGFKVDYLGFYSKDDNKHYPLALPNDETTQWFKAYLNKIRHYEPSIILSNINPNKCQYCIYAALCDQTSLSLK